MLAHLFNKMWNRNFKKWNSRRIQRNRKKMYPGEGSVLGSFLLRNRLLQQTQPREKELVLACGLRAWEFLWGSGGSRRLQQLVTSRPQWGHSSGSGLCCSLYIQSRIRGREWRHPQRADLSHICESHWDNPQRHFQSPISQVTLESVKLTVSPNHHRQISKKQLWYDPVYKYVHKIFKKNFFHTLKCCKDDSLIFSLFYL